MTTIQLPAHLQAQLPRIAVYALLGLAAISVSGQIYNAASLAYKSQQDTRPSHYENKQHSTEKSLNTSAVGELFGQSSAPVQAAIPETTMRLILRGALATDNPSQASAIIATQGQANSDKLYLVGERIPGGAILKNVYPDRIILERGTTLESLPFPSIEQNSPIHRVVAQTPPAKPNNQQQTKADENYLRALEQRMREFKQRVQELDQSP